jgi:hypothetical protein
MLHATTTAVQMAAPVQNILDTPSHTEMIYPFKTKPFKIDFQL